MSLQSSLVPHIGLSSESLELSGYQKMPSLCAAAKPYTFSFEVDKTALVLIDFQKDFIEPGGFGEIQGANLKAVQASVEPAKCLLGLARRAKFGAIVHTREGHDPSLNDCPTPKLRRQANAPGSRHTIVIGDKGPAGSRMLVRGEAMHDFVPDLQPFPGEIVIDKPGKGAFYATELHQLLVNRSISHIIIAGVTTECCVTTTLREANDRGYECLLISDATDGYVPAHKESCIEMVSYSDGLFGYVSDMTSITDTLLTFCEEREKARVTDWDGSLDIDSLHSAYEQSIITPMDVIKEVYRRIALPSADAAVWLCLIPEAESLERAEQLLRRYPDPNKRPPLFGIPFSVKDSIDIAGLPTTAACPKYAYTAVVDAPSFKMLIDAGGIVIGKVNLDQLATGLVGMRSPYTQPASVFSPEYVSGGSSSGSAVSVASKQVSFSLATDTAGSGRVPAAFNNIIGFKPTRGTIPAAGIVPCCLSLDCVAIEANTINDTRQIWNVLYNIDPNEPFSKVFRPPWALAPRAFLHPQESFKFAAPSRETESRKTVTDEFNALFDKTVDVFKQIGGELVETVDYTVFEDAGRLLYEGSFVAERVSGIKEWYDANPPPLPNSGEEDALLPEIRSIYSAAATSFTAADAWRDAHQMMKSQRLAQQEFSKVQILLVPTVPFHPTKAQYLLDPIALNHKLGKFTHYANILDLCGVSCPAGFTEDGMPFAVSVIGPSFSDGLVLEIAKRFESCLGLPVGVAGKRAI